MRTIFVWACLFLASVGWVKAKSPNPNTITAKGKTLKAAHQYMKPSVNIRARAGASAFDNPVLLVTLHKATGACLDDPMGYSITQALTAHCPVSFTDCITLISGHEGGYYYNPATAARICGVPDHPGGVLITYNLDDISIPDYNYTASAARPIRQTPWVKNSYGKPCSAKHASSYASYALHYTASGAHPNVYLRC